MDLLEMYEKGASYEEILRAAGLTDEELEELAS